MHSFRHKEKYFGQENYGTIKWSSCWVGCRSCLQWAEKTPASRMELAEHLHIAHTWVWFFAVLHNEFLNPCKDYEMWSVRGDFHSHFAAHRAGQWRVGSQHQHSGSASLRAVKPTFTVCFSTLLLIYFFLHPGYRNGLFTFHIPILSEKGTVIKD